MEVVVYMLQDGEAVPVDYTYHNEPKVRAPRITAVNLLIQARKPGFENPFPPSAELKLVQFRKTHGDIHVKVENPAAVEDKQLDQMTAVLVRTLSQFHIRTVDLILED